MARLEERFEQLRSEAEKQGFQDIEGIVDPVLIRLKVQDARQRLMDACYEGTPAGGAPLTHLVLQKFSASIARIRGSMTSTRH